MRIPHWPRAITGASQAPAPFCISSAVTMTPRSFVPSTSAISPRPWLCLTATGARSGWSWEAPGRRRMADCILARGSPASRLKRSPDTQEKGGTDMANLKLTDVEKTYGGTINVLNNINLDIRQGELVVFVGPSGCGKSTLLRMIAGLEQITGGTLEIDGQVVNDMPPALRGIAMVFQSYALYPHMTVRENMQFALKIAKKPQSEIDAAVDRAAKMLQLDPYLDRLPKALSGGQRQRVAIGRSIVRDPKVYLFDEPLSNLDAALRVATRIEIAQLKEQMPESTMIYVTHDQVEAMTLATRIVVLAGGGIAQVGSPLSLYEKPASTFVAQFIGSPAMNLLGGKIVGTGETTTLELAQGGGTITSNYPSRDEDMGMSVQVGIRPEDMEATESENFAFHGTVDIVEALGEVTQLYFDTPSAERETNTVIAKLHGIHPNLRGQDVRMTADPRKVHIFKDGVSLLYRDEKVFLPGVQPH